MSSKHPVDLQGRALPDSSWPADRHAPGRLELLRRFCNTTNLESGADRLRSAADFAAWLREQGVAPFDANAADLVRCVELREAVRDACSAHRGGTAGVDDAEALSDVARLANGIGFRIEAGSDGFGLVAGTDHLGADRLIAELLLVLLESRAAGTWNRLKACRSCRWVVYDGSKNRSAQWCSMSACGGRAKVRAHRARAADDAPA